MVGGEVLGADVTVDPALGVAQEVPGQLLNLPGPGGGPHEHLSVGPNLLENLPDLGLEAHIQHPVGLVEDQVGGPFQVHLPGLQEVDQTAGGRNADLGPVLDVPQLGSLRRSSEDTDVLDAG